jgi:hypothetical protein
MASTTNGNARHRSLDEGDDRDHGVRDMSCRDEHTEPADDDDAHEVGDDHQSLAIHTVDGDAGGKREQGVGKDAREADEARQRRRISQLEHEQRVGDSRRLGADGRQRLPGLQQDEVPVAAERHRHRAYPREYHGRRRTGRSAFRLGPSDPASVCSRAP